MQDPHASQDSIDKFLTGQENHALTRPSLQARVHAAGHPARAARRGCAPGIPRVFAGTRAKNRGGVPPTTVAPSTGYLCIRGRYGAARTARDAFVPAGTRVTSSSSDWGFAAGDGMPCHSQRIVCSSRTGLIGGNHPRASAINPPPTNLQPPPRTRSPSHSRCYWVHLVSREGVNSDER